MCLCSRTCPVVTTVVSMARAVRKAFRESYVDRCGPLGVQLCTKYRLHVFLLPPLALSSSKLYYNNFQKLLWSSFLLIKYIKHVIKVLL